MASKLCFGILLLGNLSALVLGHGYLMDPASRNACYKYFKECKTNYNANEQNCGGRQIQISLGDKCGVCGDRYDSPNPRHVYPGKYAAGFRTRTYKEGQEITAKVHITVNHKGWFEYRIGKIGTPPITQSKLKYLLTSPDGLTRFPLAGSAPGYAFQVLFLPRELTCDHCVLQWWWRVGNSWGCDDGGCGLGHGNQETFVNCADVRIVADEGVDPPPPLPPTGAPPPTKTPPPPSPNPPNPGGCKSTGAWAGNAGIDTWCKINCAAGFCPSHMCICT